MFKHVFTLSSMALVACAWPAPQTNHLEPRQIPTEPCASGVHVIATGGGGLKNIGKLGLLSSLANDTVASIPGSTSVQVPYPKGSNGIYAITVGTTRLKQYIDDYHNACPNTKIVLLGYSEGAFITMNTLCGGFGSFSNAPLDASYAEYIAATVVYGDLTRAAGQSYNLGSCSASGRFPRTNTANCQAFASNLQSYCDGGDPECCAGGIDPSAHFKYPMRYDDGATEFVVSKAASSMSSSSVPPSPSSTGTDQSSAPTPSYAPAPSTAAPPPPGSGPGVPSSVPSPVSSDPYCPADLSGDYEYPHLIVPVSRSSPNTAYGTSYDGTINDDTSTIFNFDIPASSAGKTCSVVFFLPEDSDLTTSSYSISGSGDFTLTGLDSPALESTTYNTVPRSVESFQTFDLVPGQSSVITSGPCAAGSRIGYEMSASSDKSLNYFQNYGNPPIGLYVRLC